MAETKSTQMTNDDASPPVINDPSGLPQLIPWDYTVVTTALGDGDTVLLCRVPAGKVWLHNSYMRVSASVGASTHIDIGHAAYVDKNGTTIVADPDAIVNGRDGAVITPTTLNTDTVGTPSVKGYLDLSDASGDVTLYATVLDAGGTADVDIADVWDGAFYVTK